MEIELKYRIPDPETAEKILKDAAVEQLRDSDCETLDMESLYYDTEDMALTGAGIAFRIRKEGRHYMATLKWDGESRDGMHHREEINVPLGTERPEDCTAEIFSQSEMYGRLNGLIGEKRLEPLLKIDFVRKQERIDGGKFLCEMSVDEGEILADGKAEALRELEIELYSGQESEMERFGAGLMEKYSLVPEDASKFKRGLDLLARKKQGQSGLL